MNELLDAIVLGVHLTGAAIWVGGTIALGLAAGALRGPPLEDARAYSTAVTRVARRFAWVMWPALVLTILTGVYNLSWYLPGGLADLPNAPTVLLEKMWLVAFVVLVSGLHTFLVGPLVRRRLRADGDAAGIRGLRRLNMALATLSLAGSLGILFLAAALPFY